MYQDDFYYKKESNSFYKRWKKDREIFNNAKVSLRPTKKQILKILENNYDLRNKKILEIGCFIGDLLSEIKNKYKSSVFGIEPSSLACKFAKDYFNLKLENSTFFGSKYFSIKKKNFQKFDIIIF